MHQSHQDYMNLALQLAERGRLSVSPNPMVGCVIVKDHTIVGSGYHQCAGQAHAEVHALQAAGKAAHAATAYVTLEPCCHYGKTPPCTQALIQAGIKKIYIACLDPNPLMNGLGAAALRAAGITVDIGLARAQAQQLNEVFFHFMKTQRPFVIAKWAMSLDGKTIVNASDHPHISGKVAHAHAHEIRQQVDAILIGANTACRDNPQLTVRLSPTPIKQPIRMVVSSHTELPLHLQLLQPMLAANTWIATTSATRIAWQQAVRASGAKLLILPQDATGQVDLLALLKTLAAENITSLLVEGGMTLHTSFFAQQLVNKIQLYLAPNIIGAHPIKQFVSDLQMEKMGEDIYLTATCQESHHV